MTERIGSLLAMTASEQTKPTETQQQFSRFWTSEGGQATPRDLAVGSSLHQLAKCLDKAVSPDMARFYMAVLAPLTQDQCIKAFSTALERCKFFPSPAELRAYGSPAEPLEVDPITQEAKDALAEVFAILREFGPKFKPIYGAVIRDRDADGRILNPLDFEREPTIYPPPMPHLCKLTLRILGYGDPHSGVQLVCLHSSSGHSPGGEPRYIVRDNEKVEQLWINAYRRAKAGE